MGELQRTRCLNCEETFSGSYCPSCGQGATTKRLETREIATDIISHLFNFDSRILHTAVGLSLNPGRVCKEYVGGKRVRYVQPFRYCLTIVAVMIFWHTVIGVDVVAIAPKFAQPTEGRPQRIVQEIQPVVGTFVEQHLNYIIIAGLPILALIVRAFFRKSGYNYAEVSAFVLFVMAQVILFGLAALVFGRIAPGLVFPLRLAIHFGFFSWGAIVFFDVPVVIGVIKSVAATFLYFIVVALIGLILVMPKLISILRPA